MIDRELLKELAGMEDRVPSFLSVYINFSKEYERYLERRKHECIKALHDHKELRNQFVKNIEMVERHLEKNEEEYIGRCAAIFSSRKHGFFRTYVTPKVTENVLIVDTSPYIKPLAELVQDWEPFLILLLDHHHARMLVVSYGEITDEMELTKDIMNKHKKGGWSQMRFQRLRQGAIDHFFKDVKEHLEAILKKDGVKRIIIAGPGGAKKQFENYMPKHLHEEIVGIMDADMHISDGELVKEGIHVFFENEMREENQMVRKFRAEILRSGLVTYGVNDTFKAVTQGRGELLLMLEDSNYPGWKCGKCGAFGVGSASECTQCRKENPYLQDIMEEIVEASELMDTKIEFVRENEFLESIGGVGLFLRY